ncbi:MAG: glycoside hydrolase family 9 protein [Terriglobales bacterium]
MSFPKSLLFIGLMLGGALPSAAQVRVLVNQVGYEPAAPKWAIVEAPKSVQPRGFALIDAATERVVMRGQLEAAGSVRSWDNWAFWYADISSWRRPGQYILRTQGPRGPAQSCPFEIEDDVLERNTLSNVIYYFKGQRAAGLLDRADRHLADPERPGRFVDVHGGWYDATGDYGIHFSQLSLTSFFNTQQVPLVAWSLLASYNALQARGDDNFSEYQRRLLTEGLFGADFIARMYRPGGSFFESISAPGIHKLPQDRSIGSTGWLLKVRTKATDAGGVLRQAAGAHAYEVSFRDGGGMAIAALALASTMPAEGDIARTVYLQDAAAAFAFLAAHDRELLNDGQPNILDDYCALMAATELYRATRDPRYLAAADGRADRLMARQIRIGKYDNAWRADDGSRPFFHPSDAGLPVVSLLNYYAIASPAQRRRVRNAVARSLRFQIAITAEGANPFGYARELVRLHDGQVRPAFFFPHDTEASPWWQGENARLASLAAAARLAAPLYAIDSAFQAQLEEFAVNQLSWILGRNPFDACMLNGSGHGFPPYMFFRSWKYTNAPGAIINGITAGFGGIDTIAFNQGYAVTGRDDDWRWSEQWLPHAAWYLYAVSLGRKPAALLVPGPPRN